jgi:Protein of unknown function (DUF2934)
LISKKALLEPFVPNGFAEEVHMSFPSEVVAPLAYLLWEERGRPEGTPETDWFRAEAVLQSQEANAGDLPFASISVTHLTV